MEIISQSEIKEIVLHINSFSKIPSHDLDEMAIPTYLHKSGLIKWLFWKRLRKILKLAESEPVKNVLDFGCGIGVLLPSLQQIAKGQVHATDLFPQFAKELACRREIPVLFHDSNNLKQSIPAGSIDLIVAADSMEHLDNPEEYLNVFSELLSDQGRLIVSGPTENFMYKIGRAIAGFGDKGGYHHTNINSLEKTIINSGFKQLQTKHLPFRFPPYLFKVVGFRKE